MTYKGFDSFASVTGTWPQQLSQLGYRWFGRYYRKAPLEGGKGNAVSRKEMAGLFSAGLWSVALYQNTADTPAYFTAKNAREDAAAAIAAARFHGQTLNTPIFFAVDCNPGPQDIQAVISYFLLVKEALWQAGYKCGVYGSGYVCSAVKGEGACHYTWLSNAKGWRGYLDWLSKADIVQSSLPHTLPFGLQVDEDLATGVGEPLMWRKGPEEAQEAPKPAPGHQPPAEAPRGLWGLILAILRAIFGR